MESAFWLHRKFTNCHGKFINCLFLCLFLFWVNLLHVTLFLQSGKFQCLVFCIIAFVAASLDWWVFTFCCLTGGSSNFSFCWLTGESRLMLLMHGSKVQRKQMYSQSWGLGTNMVLVWVMPPAPSYYPAICNWFQNYAHLEVECQMDTMGSIPMHSLLGYASQV